MAPQRTFSAASRTPAAASRAPVARAPAARPAPVAAAVGMPRFAQSRAAPAVSDKTAPAPRASTGAAPSRHAPPASARHTTGPSRVVDPQARARIARPDSPWEREASRVVTRLRDPSPARDARPEPRADAAGVGRPSLAHPGLGPSPPATADASHSQPLPPALRRQLEAEVGFDLSSVRVLSGPKIFRAATALGARAYTQHGQIHLGPGATIEDPALLAHETAHVLQQTLATPHLARLGLTPAPAESILRQPFRGSTFADRRQARAALNDPASLPFWQLPRSLFRALDWIGDDGFAARVLRAVPEALHPTLHPFRFLKPYWEVARQHAENFPGRQKLWHDIASLAGATDDPALIAASRNVANNLPDFLGSRWTIFQRMLESSAVAGKAASHRWENGFASLAPDIADRLDSLPADLASAFVEYPSDSWAAGSLRTALGCPAHLRTAASVIAWVNAQRDRADQWIRDLAGPARSLQTAQYDTASFARLAAQHSRAQSLARDFRSAADLIAAPEGVMRHRATIATLLPRVRAQIAPLTFELSTPAQSYLRAFDGLDFTVQSLSRAPALALFSNEFDWLEQDGTAFHTWISQREPELFVVARESLEGVEHWHGLVVESAVEAESSDLDSPDVDAGFFRHVRRAWAWVWNTKEKFVKRLLEKVPLLRELSEQAPDLWRKAQQLFARFRERIFKEGKILAPLWEFFLGVLELAGLPVEFIRDVASRVGSLLGKILKHPIVFLRNLANGIAQGFQRFGRNIGDHLLNGLLSWLLGEFNLPSPPTLEKIIHGLLAQLGFSKANVCDRIAKHLSKNGRTITADFVEKRIDAAIKAGVTAVKWLKMVFAGDFAGFWREIKHHLSELWRWIVDRTVTFVVDRLKQKLMMWLARFLDPTGLMAAINTIQAIYSAIVTAVRYVETLLAMAREVFRAIREIADGQIDRAAMWVEAAAARGLAVAIGFFAQLLRLGSIINFLKQGRDQIRKWVDAGIDAGVRATGDIWEWLVITWEQVKAWWEARRAFTDADGKRRTLSIDQSAVLYVSETEAQNQMIALGTPLTLHAYLAAFKPKNDHQSAVHSELLNHSNEIDKIKAAAGGSFSAADGERIYALFNNIVYLLSLLGGRHAIPPATQVKWTPATILGDEHGQKMVAEYLSVDPGGNIGSKPVSTTTKLWDKVRQHKRGNDTAYIKGHLLNHHLHGPGTWKNMMPIARTTNSKMEQIAEGEVKKAVIGENRVVRYEVTMVMDPHPKTPKTNAEAELPSHIELKARELILEGKNWVPKGKVVLPFTRLENELR